MKRVSMFLRGSTWWVYYRVQNQRVRKSLETQDKRIATRKAELLERKLINNELEAYRGRIRFDAFWEKFLPYSTSIKRPKTVDTEQRTWKRFQEWLLTQRIRYMDQVTKSIVESYRRELLSCGLSKVSVNIHHRCLSAIFTYAMSEGYIDGNPFRQVKKFKITEKPPRFMSLDEIDAVMKAAASFSNEMHMVYGLGIYAGFRRGEIENARWEWFNLDSKIIIIQPYGDFVPKSHRARPIPMNNKLKEILSLYRKDKGYLLQSYLEEGEGRNPQRYDFKNGFKAVKKLAGVEWITPHVMRHTFASQLAKAGVSLYKIQQWLGHSDPRTTMIYAHLQAQDDEIDLI